MSRALHEDYRRAEEVKAGSERSFGFVFAAVFALVGLWPLLDGGAPRLWSLIAASGFLACALLRPGLLRPLNRLWTRLGLLLHRIVSPLVLGLIFFVAVTPTGWLLRLFGKDPLGLRLERGGRSYWILRDPPGPAPDSMRNQF